MGDGFEVELLANCADVVGEIVSPILLTIPFVTCRVAEDHSQQEIQ